MGAVSYTLTLTTVPQRLSAVFAGSDDPNVGGKYDVPLRLICFQSLKANTTDILIGADFVFNGVSQGPLVTTSKHGLRLDPGDTAPSLPIGSYDSGGSKISDFWAAGASGGEVLLILGITF